MLSELATCLYALTATRDNGLWGPRRRQFLPKALSDVSVQHCRTDCWGEWILPEPKGQEGGLAPRPVTQRAGVLGVISRRSPSHRFRPAGDLSGELR